MLYNKQQGLKGKDKDKKQFVSSPILFIDYWWDFRQQIAQKERFL